MFFKEKEQEKKAKEKNEEAARAQRINALIKAEFYDDKRKCIDFIKDISKVGLFISIARPFEKGAVLDIKFTLPDANYPIKVKGKVVWSRSEPEGVSKMRGMGVKFLNLAPWDEEALRNFVETKRK